MGKKSVSEGVRWQIVGLSRVNNLKLKTIAQMVGVSEKCVRTTIKNFRETGSAKERARSGRPEVTSDREKSFISRTFLRDPKLSLRKGTTFCRTSLARGISYSTTRRVLKKKGLTANLATKKQFLSIMDKRKRLKWCKERRHWSIDKWRSVIFTDESNFEVLNRKAKFWFWRKKNPSTRFNLIRPRTQGGGGSIGIWGCINASGAGMASIYDGRLNSERYQNILSDNLQPSLDLFELRDDYIFQQDNAPCHTSRLIKAYFAQESINVMPWPARSPDLNPIENLWVWIDKKLQENPIKNLEELRQATNEAWLNVPTDLCQKLIESMPKRLNACIKARGGHINY